MAAFETINRGLTANDGSGDPAREWARKTNDNFGKAANLEEQNYFQDFISIGSNTFIDELGVYNPLTSQGSFIRISNEDNGYTASDGCQVGISSSGDMLVRNYEDMSILFFTNAVQRMELSKDGDLAVPFWYDTTTASASNVFINSSGQLRRSTSSRKLKKDISKDISTDLILKVEPVKFKERKTNKEHIGFIAEQVASVDKRFATNLDSELPGIDINALLSAAVLKIHDLEERLKKLESK